MRSGSSVDTPPDGETAMGPSLPTECEASCSAWAVDCLLAARSYWKGVGFRKKGTSLGDYGVCITTHFVHWVASYTPKQGLTCRNSRVGI